MLFRSTSFSSYISEDSSHEMYSVDGVLINGEAVCQGYAETIKLFLDLLDVESHLVFGFGVHSDGTREAHVWNLVKLDDDNWYHVDATWNDPYPDVVGRVLYTYFNLSDDLILEDHIINEGQNLPAATSLSYYGKENQVEAT